MNFTGPYSNFLLSSRPSSGRPRVVLTVGGSDPTGGAGIQADLKTFQHFGVHGLSVVTAVTVQNTHGVRSANPVEPELVEAQLSALGEDIPIDAIKIGMLTTSEVVEVVSNFVAKQRVPTVVDPIVASSSGTLFLDNATLDTLSSCLCPFASVITPNISEASAFTEIVIKSEDDLLEAARRLVEEGAESVLLKGGHATGPESRDLYYDGTNAEWLSAPRRAKQVHGTGCVLSSAIASGLALGLPARDAVHIAKEFITEMIERAMPLGAGPEIFQFASPFIEEPVEGREPRGGFSKQATTPNPLLL